MATSAHINSFHGFFLPCFIEFCCKNCKREKNLSTETAFRKLCSWFSSSIFLISQYFAEAPCNAIPTTRETKEQAAKYYLDKTFCSRVFYNTNTAKSNGEECECGGVVGMGEQKQGLGSASSHLVEEEANLGAESQGFKSGLNLATHSWCHSKPFLSELSWLLSQCPLQSPSPLPLS